MLNNEHVELRDLRGSVSDELNEAFEELDAIASQTKCNTHLFSLSLKPPEETHVSREDFERTVAQIERKVDLEEHARALVFHETERRREAPRSAPELPWAAQ